MKRLMLLFLSVVLMVGFSMNTFAVSPIKVVQMKIQNEPIISLYFVFHTGSIHDPEGKIGLARLTASLMSDGGTLKNSIKVINEKMYPIASGYGARVDREYINFNGQTHIDNLETFYTLFKEAILEPAFNEEDFTRIKTQMINGIKNNLRYSSDEELGKAVFKSFVYRGTPYEKNVAGTVSNLESITLDDVKAFYKSHFLQDNLIIGIGGNYPATLPDRIVADFSKLPSSNALEYKKIVPEKINGLQVIIVDKPTVSAGIHIGFPIDLMRKDPDFHALFLANSWLGEHRNSSSHLYQVIREKRGMNYGDYSYIEDFPNGGGLNFPPSIVYKNPQLFEIWIRPVEKDKRVFALRAALRELKSLIDNGMKKEDFELTKKFLAKYCQHYADTTAQRLGYKIDDMIYGLKESHLDNFRKNIEALTLDQVNKAIKKHLQYNNLRIVFVTSDGEQLKNDLVTNAPSPITYRTPKPEEVLTEDKEIAVFSLKVLPENVTIIKVDDIFK